MDEIIIEPNKSLKRFWQELWAYRELFYFLAWKDILIRYKQTVIGIDGFRWALLGKEASLYMPGFLISIGLAITLFITGALFFTKTERKFADII